MGKKRKYEQILEEEGLDLNSDDRVFQRAFLDYLVEKNGSYFQKRANKKLKEKRDTYSALEEAQKNPKMDKNGKTYFEIGYVDIFGRMSSKKFYSLKDLQKYQDGIKKDIESLDKKATIKITPKNIKNNIKDFFTSGKCPDFSDGEYSKDKIINGFNKVFKCLKDFIANKELQKDFNEAQLPKLTKGVLDSLKTLNENEINEIKSVQLTEEEILDSKTNSLEPESVYEDINDREKEIFDPQMVEVNKKLFNDVDRHGRPVNIMKYMNNMTKENIHQYITDLSDINKSIERLPWYSKVFGSKYNEIKEKLTVGYETLKSIGINKTFAEIYVTATDEEKLKLNRHLDPIIDEVVANNTRSKGIIEQYEEALEKHNQKETLDKDFAKLKEKNEEVNVKDLELPDEIFDEDIIQNSDLEVESNKNFIKNEKELLDDNEKDEIDFDIDSLTK